ncbi:MAG TPA: ABC transporter substrate-binding protein [Stellaceae bacterium]|jgi:peptide/nickel transport system substrate-binding protein|nr:ABC transporter substrate-binding protein [Stellaceae bacterium]
MPRRVTRCLAGILALGLLLSSGAVRAALLETPEFAAQVASGALPPVAQRVPSEPALADLETLGRPGGELHMLMASPKDTRLMVVYGYARLVAYTSALALVPDMLEQLDVDGDRVFTLHLRAGHKWSDGQPFTAEDFRYWFEDVAENPELSPAGLPAVLMPNGEKPKFEVIDQRTIRYSWSHPNPLFLPALAGPDPLFIFCPSHYMKQFHKKYADKATLDGLVKQAGARNWAALHSKMDAMYRNDNPDMPSLEPWVLKTRPPADQLVFERNPYYYRVDGAGHQLPYIDRVVYSIASSKIIPAKTGAGESDLQARYLSFDDYTFLKAGEAAGGYRVVLWRTGPGSQLALYPNVNADDPVWRGLMRDVRFRRALSLATNRHEINQVIYFGLAIEGQNTVLPESPLYRPEYRSAWSGYDIDQADKLLDEIGLKRGSDGLRTLPDGRPLDIVVEDSGESVEKSDVLELIRDSWRRVGIRLFSRPMQLTLFRRRVFSGQTLMSLDKGLENGLATAEMSPWELAPTSQQQLEWPKWGQYAETNGKAGEPPDLDSAIRLKTLYDSWLAATGGDDEHAKIWHDILQAWSDQVFSIGLVGGVQQPVVINTRLRNVPDDGMYNWDPGAHFGIYKPDGFWFDKKGSPGASAELTEPPH